MLYITLLDQFHPGIYSSQVIDVCDYLTKKEKTNIRLVAFLSIKELLRTDARKKIKALSPNAIVFPAFPGLKYFQLTAIFLFFICLLTGERVAICRNVFCTRMALRIKKIGLLKKVVLDGRSSLSAEIEEYDVFPIDYLRQNIRKIESYAVLNSDFRMAVSSKLILDWGEKYNYNSENHIVIPCTLDSKFFDSNKFSITKEVEALKQKLGYSNDDIVAVYSGSTAPWQSFEILEKLFQPFLQNLPNFKILFLSKENKDNLRLKNKYPKQVNIIWLEHKDVLNHLKCCDYGILVREQSTTNYVASPTKFAEYLSAGLNVLISDNLGDFSEFVRENNCGVVLNENDFSAAELSQTTLDEKERNFNLAYSFFRKESETNSTSYKKLSSYLNT